MLTFILFALLNGPQAAKACGAECPALTASLSKKDVELTRIRDILKKNEDYLVKHTSLPTSVTVKVRSNMVVSKLQIETIQNERTAITQSMDKQGCKKCRTPNTKDI